MEKKEVTIRYGLLVRTYELEADSPYRAKLTALNLFLTENGIPGRPVDYLTRKRHLIEVSCRSSHDGRKDRHDVPVTAYSEYLLEQLQKTIGRRDDLPAKKKTKATDLVLKLQEVLQ